MQFYVSDNQLRVGDCVGGWTIPDVVKALELTTAKKIIVMAGTNDILKVLHNFNMISTLLVLFLTRNI